MQNNLADIGTAERRSLAPEEGDDARTPLVNSPTLVALITKEFQAIERIERHVAESRQDIKTCVKRMVAKGLSKKGIKAALARRKLVVTGELDEMDETLALICDIPAFGMQLELFGSSGNGPANGEGL